MQGDDAFAGAGAAGDDEDFFAGRAFAQLFTARRDHGETATCCWSSRTNRSRFFTSVAATASSCRDGSVRAFNRSSADCRAASADGLRVEQPSQLGDQRRSLIAGVEPAALVEAVVAELPALGGRVVQVGDAVDAGVARRRGRV